MSRKQVDSKHYPLLEEIGFKLHEIRKSKNLDIKEMADTLKISRNGLALMEKGKIYFNLSTLLTILDHYKIDHKEFFHEMKL